MNRRGFLFAIPGLAVLAKVAPAVEPAKSPNTVMFRGHPVIPDQYVWMSRVMPITYPPSRVDRLIDEKMRQATAEQYARLDRALLTGQPYKRRRRGRSRGRK